MFKVGAKLLNHNFSRNSVAYLDGTEYAADTPRTREGWLANTSDGRIEAAVGVGSEPVLPQCSVGSTMYGRGYDANSYVYSSTDGGATWTKISTQTGIKFIYATPGGKLLGAAYGILYRSTDGGVNWSNVTPTSGYTAGCITVPWGYTAGGASGTDIYIAEYISTQSAFASKYVWKSTTDGASWTLVFDASDYWSGADPANQPYHIHGLGWHATTGRLVVGFGDGFDRRRMIVTADGGANWPELIALSSGFVQPVAFLDAGDATRILCGGDDGNCLYWLNVTTGAYDNAWDENIRGTNLQYVFSLGKLDGIYYAVLSTTQADASTLARAILISPDGTNWIVWRVFSATEDIARCINFPVASAGRIHWTMVKSNGDQIHFSTATPQITEMIATLLSPACTNARGEPLSSHESATSWNWASLSGAALTVSRSNAYAEHGDYAIKALGANGNSGGGTVNLYLRSTTTITLSQGVKYIITARMRASQACAARLTTTLTSGSSFSVGQYYTIGQNWRTVYSSVMTGGAGGTAVYLRIDIAQGALAAELYVDCVQVNATPICPWQIGSTSQAADSLSQTLRTESSWSDVFVIQPLAYEETYEAAAALTIKTWSLDADNKIVLTFDPADNKFKITRIIDGTPEAAVLSAAQYWHGEQPIRFVLSVSASAVHLAIDNAGQTETLDDGGMAALVSDDITATYGDFPMWVLHLAAAHLAVFRSEDPEDFDWATPAHLEPYPITGHITLANQALMSDTTYYYLARAVSPLGQLSDPVLTDAMAVVVQDDGSVEPPVGNEPTDLTVTAIAGGALRVQWRYVEADQPATPTGFKIYQSSDATDWTCVHSDLFARRNYYHWLSPALSDSELYYYRVRAYRTVLGTDYETANTNQASDVADSTGPAPPGPIILNI